MKAIHRRTFLQISLTGVAAGAAPGLFSANAGAGKSTTMAPFKKAAFELDEVTVAELQAGLASGKFTARSLAQKYIARIQAIDVQGPTLRSVIELNPDALDIAARLDQERKQKRLRGSLHGIPILIKDNIDTHDRMMTTAGSLALVGSVPLQDAFLVEKLRAAGAVLLGKTNLSEWANFRGARSTSGWSGRGGQTRNPYALDRNPSGSSSGSAVAASANLCAIAIGTETDGSILSPSSYNGIVGIKPTVGLISRAGIIPISKSQDTAGPMARTVRDAALLLGVLAGPDPRDPVEDPRVSWTRDYLTFLDRDGLRGARLGVVRKLFGSHPGANLVMEAALKELERLGAVLIDPVELFSRSQLGDAESTVFLYEFKAGLNTYLASLGPKAPRHNLQDLIEFNDNHRDQEMPWFGQESFISAQAKGPLTEKSYLDALATCRRVARQEGIDATMEKHRLAALIAPTTGPAHVTDHVHGDRGSGSSTSPAAVAGYPSITVPAGTVAGLPVGLSFFGKAWSEPVLIRLAYAFEQATKHRQTPRFLPTLAS